MSDEGGGFSLSELGSIYRGDPEGMREICLLFQADAPSRVAQFQAHLEKEEWAEAREAVHGLANLLGAVRHHEGVALSRKAEGAIKEERYQAALELAPEVAAEVTAVLRAVDRLYRAR